MTVAFVLDLRQNVALERLELHVELTSLPQAHDWVHSTLRMITSPVFSEFVIWVLDGDYQHGLVPTSSWEVVESSLGALAERNPNFRVVFRGARPSFVPSFRSACCDRARSFFEAYLPTVLSKGFARFEYIHNRHNPVRKLHRL